MISLKKLLLENPDTVTYNGHEYSYNTTSNICTYSIFEDPILDQVTYLGYNSNLKQFLSNNQELLNYAKNNKFIPLPKTNAGGHSLIEDVLSTYYGKNNINIYDTELYNYRLFEIEGKIISTSWAVNDKQMEHKNVMIEVIKKSGYDPKNVLFEGYTTGDTKFTYDEFINNFQQKQSLPQSTEIDKQLDKEIKEKNYE